MGGSATSLGLPEELGVSSAALDALRQSADPHVVYADFEHRGYGVVTVTKDELRGEFKAITTTTQPNGTPFSLAKFTVESGTPTLHKV